MTATVRSKAPWLENCDGCTDDRKRCQSEERSYNENYYCCMPKGHGGDHAACGQHWPNKDDDTKNVVKEPREPRGGVTVASSMRTDYERKNLDRLGDLDVRLERLYRTVREQSYPDNYLELDEEARNSIQSEIDDYLSCIDSDLDMIVTKLDEAGSEE